MQRQNQSPCAPLLAAVTDAPQSRLAIWVNLMRDEVFHRALDWQRAEDAVDGVRKAHAHYHFAPGFSDGVKSPHLAECRLAELEARLEKARNAAAPVKPIEPESKVRPVRDSSRVAQEAIPRLADLHDLA